MRKKYIQILSLFFILILIKLSFASSVDDLAWAVAKLAQLKGKNIKIEELKGKIKKFQFDTVHYGLEKAVIKAARSQGLYLNGFRLREKADIFLFSEEDYFIAKFKNNFYLCSITNNGVKIFQREGSSLVSDRQFLNNFSDPILSLPVIGILLKRLDSAQEKKGRFIVAYSYHKEKFEKFEKLLSRLLREAKEKGYKMIYVDELGLIPPESIKRIVKEDNVEEKVAFRRAKKGLLDELKLIEKGIPIYDKNLYYKKIYALLAKERINVEMEDLSYENWKAIVAFDDLNLNQLAVSLFARSFLDRYLETARQYSNGFWQYNVYIRDGLFLKQIEKILKNNSSSIVFTLRGLGHYGMEENFSYPDYTTEVIILGDGDFEEILVSDQLLQIYRRNGVYVPPEKEKLFYLRAFPEECIRNYIQNELKETLIFATMEAVRMVSRLKEEDIKRLSLDLSHALYQGKLRSAQKIYEFVYHWVRNRN